MLVAFLFLAVNYGQAFEPSNCGKYREPDLLPIVGGLPVTAKDMPWIVAIKSSTRQDVLCTGSLISPRHVITGGHCFADLFKKPCERDRDNQFRYVCHGLDANLDEQCDGFNQKAKRYDIAKISFLNAYINGHCTLDDLVILTLKQEVANVVPICLPFPENGEVYYNKTKKISLFSTGYSRNSLFPGNPYVTNKLTFGRMGLPHKCKMPKTDNGEPMRDVICTDNTEQGAVCDGDSGGPLTEMHDDRLVLVGIHSRSGGICMTESTPPTAELTAVEVSAYITQIQNVMNEAVDPPIPFQPNGNIGYPNINVPAYPGPNVPNTQIQNPPGQNPDFQIPGGPYAPLPNEPYGPLPNGPYGPVPNGPNGPSGPYGPYPGPNAPLPPNPYPGGPYQPVPYPQEPIALPMPG